MVHAIWTDEARARMTLRLLTVIAAGTGADPGEYTDPADLLDELAGQAPDSGRAADPGERAAQVASFLAAAGHD